MPYTWFTVLMIAVLFVSVLFLVLAVLLHGDRSDHARNLYALADVVRALRGK